VLSLHAAYLPGWSAEVDGRRAEVRPVGPFGLVGVDLLPGEHVVRFGFEGTTVHAAASAATMATALVLLFVRPWPWRRALGRTSRLGWWVSAAARLLLAALAAVLAFAASGQLHGVGVAPPTGARQVGAALGGYVQLAAVSVGKQAVEPGAIVPLSLYWLGTGSVPANLKVFVQLQDQAKRSLAQADGLPVLGVGRTSAWVPGEIVRDDRQLAIPGDVSPGDYRLVVGLYDPATGARPAVTLSEPSPAVGVVDGNAVVVGVLRLLPPS
jgi:hypothetical protein